MRKILSACGQYNRHVLVVTGRYFANRHGSTLSCEQCTDRRGNQVFAVIDWNKHKKSGSEPKFDPIVKYRDPTGRPAVIEGIVTAEVEVECIAGFHVYHDASGVTYGSGKGYNGLGVATFYIRRILAVEPLRDSRKPDETR